MARRRGRPTGSTSAATREAVLDAARREFAAQGYAGTSNRAVAERTGLAHTAIYNHFGSKAQLFTAVFLDVSDRLVVELDRSADAAPDEPPFPRVLLDAVEALRAADPSYVEFLASMYVEVRRHAELQHVFQGGADAGGAEFAVVTRLRDLAIRSGGDSSQGGEEDLWFWVAFALGLAQLGVLSDADGFRDTVAALRRRVADRPADLPQPGGPPR